uniref:Uncharacterized protein n=1 Tax=Capra hircus TaxID=9925 RepID=A0A8C2QZI5_CAPHI
GKISWIFWSCGRKHGVSLELGLEPQGPALVASGKSSLHAICEGPLRIPLQLVPGTRSSSGADAGTSRPEASVRNSAHIKGHEALPASLPPSFLNTGFGPTALGVLWRRGGAGLMSNPSPQVLEGVASTSVCRPKSSMTSTSHRQRRERHFHRYLSAGWLVRAQALLQRHQGLDVDAGQPPPLH